MTQLPAARAYAEPTVTAGFTNSASFEFTQRAARALAQSTLVPEQFRALIKEKKSGRLVENPNAIPNCIIALNMATRMGADPLMVMQNLYVVEGRPSWSAQFVIASINACGRYSPLRFDLSPEGEPRTLSYETSKWVNGSRVSEQATCTIKDRTCRAWAIEKETGERLDGPEISLAMAEAEGWLGKNGSKWQTMPEMMLRYRAASFFGRLYAPELLMGLATQEEAVEAVDFERAEDGVYQVVPQVEASEPHSAPEHSAVIPKPEPSPRKRAKPDAKPARTEWPVNGADGKALWVLDSAADWAESVIDWVNQQDDLADLQAVLDANRDLSSEARAVLPPDRAQAITAAVNAKLAALVPAQTTPHDPETGEVFDDMALNFEE